LEQKIKGMSSVANTTCCSIVVLNPFGSGDDGLLWNRIFSGTKRHVKHLSRHKLTAIIRTTGGTTNKINDYGKIGRYSLTRLYGILLSLRNKFDKQDYSAKLQLVVSGLL